MKPSHLKPKTRVLVVGIFFASLAVAQPQSLRLEDCYQLAKQNYPLVKQRELIQRSKEYTVANATKAYFPQISIQGQASYQSDVTSVPITIPGMSIPTLSKDQYKLYGELNQTVFDGGMIQQQKKIQETNALVEEQKLEVELYKVQERINQLFFGILLIDAQLKLTALTRNDIDNALKKTEAALTNGIVLKSSLDVLKAEAIKLKQREIELSSNRRVYAEMLGLYINQQVSDSTSLQKPAPLALAPTIQRPELSLLEQQQKNLDIQNGLLKAKNLPRLNLFVQAGYGRPALNMLSNEFQSYYIGGLRLSWNLSGFYTYKKDKALVDIQRRHLDVQKELFLFNTGFQIKQYDAESKRLLQLLSSDEELVTLRQSVKNAASAQLENGVIQSSDYLREVNAESQARENKLLHEIQWLQAQYNQKTSIGG